MSIRPIKSIIQARPTSGGAGAKLRRAFGSGNTGDFDPFLLLDDFRNEHPQDYLAGFPWHPHRGIETITYVLRGTVQHGDSLGNRGAMGPGDVQWMTAGSGILHQEMPKGDDAGRMHGFQLWANLPKSLPVESSRHAFAYIFEGSGTFRDASAPRGVLTEQVGEGASGAMVRDEAGNRSLVLFDSGDAITVQAGEAGIRFLLVSGRPLEEPVAWRGPIVMNTDEELRRAYAELRDGTFIRHR